MRSKNESDRASSYLQRKILETNTADGMRSNDGWILLIGSIGKEVIYTSDL